MKYLAISSKADAEICEYPDSGKFMVRKNGKTAGDSSFHFMGKAEDERDYWDGEEGA